MHMVQSVGKRKVAFKDCKSVTIDAGPSSVEKLGEVSPLIDNVSPERLASFF